MNKFLSTLLVASKVAFAMDHSEKVYACCELSEKTETPVENISGTIFFEYCPEKKMTRTKLRGDLTKDAGPVDLDGFDCMNFAVTCAEGVDDNTCAAPGDVLH